MDRPLAEQDFAGHQKKRCYNMDDNDIVFTTYEIVSREISLVDKAGNDVQSVS